MALVSYIDSESSDIEEAPAIPLTKPAGPPKKPASTQPQKLVDRSNPRKILVNLSNKGTEHEGKDAAAAAAEDAPARRKPRPGGAGIFAGFNDLLPAPKRPAQQRLGGSSSIGAVSTRRPFSLKTAAEPSFSRGDTSAAETPKAGDSATETVAEKKPEEVKFQGNAMVFKPLSIARNTAKRRKVVSSRATAAAAVPASADVKQTTETSKVEAKTSEPAPNSAPKPKVNLFGISKESEDDIPTASAAPEEDTSYSYEAVASNFGPAPEITTIETIQYPSTSQPLEQQQQQQAPSLATIADDLNLSKAQKRQLFGRQGAAGNIPSLNDANVVHFNTDQEYASNAAYLASVSEQELVAQQHNPVRSIAPGKHSLQQLVNSVHNQRDALEESFASGKRNRKEAGSKYGCNAIPSPGVNPAADGRRPSAISATSASTVPFRSRTPVYDDTKDATRRKYIYASFFLALSLVSFVVQTETAVYIQKELGWVKPYCMLYLTHGTAQMVQSQELHLSQRAQLTSPIPYLLRTIAAVTCALTIAGCSWYIAVNLTTPSDLTAIYNCSAFFAYAFSIPLLGDKLRIDKVVSVAVAIIGVFIVAYSPSSGGQEQTSANNEASNRAWGNMIIGVGSVLYGLYEVMYKRLACPPEGTSARRGVIFANTVGSLIGLFTLLFLWVPIPILHYIGLETFEMPDAHTACVLAISTLSNAVFSGSFLVLISLTSPVLSSVAALLTIFLVAIVDWLIHHVPLGMASVVGGLLIVVAFLLLAWSTYRELDEERKKRLEEEESGGGLFDEDEFDEEQQEDDA
ncbi:hypothetical protein KEM56_007263 [Ascosphaera pollenicola]|nr:hypothetical protein KEM56_007263 [Ascosphaera pollenicola]